VDDLPPPGPDRDRILARRVRYGPRFAKEAGRVLDGWWRGPDGQRIRRNRRVAGALRSILSQAELDKVEPVAIKQGVMTLAVADNLLLSELRNHRHGALVAALVEQGTGIGRVVYRLKRNPPGRR